MKRGLRGLAGGGKEKFPGWFPDLGLTYSLLPFNETAMIREKADRMEMRESNTKVCFRHVAY